MKKIIITSLFIFSIASDAHAYIDPGSTSILLQFLAAILAGIAATFKLWYFSVKSFFNKIFSKNETTENNDKKIK